MALKINDNGTDRDMTEAEETAHKAYLKIAQAEEQVRADEAEAKAEARQAVLDKLGLDADEAAALFG